MPYGPDDGTIAPWAVVASIPFAPEIVQKMAQTYLRDEEMIIVIAGDRKKIEKQLGAFGKIVG